MRGMRRRAVRVAGALLIAVALLLVPDLAAMHTHRDLAAAHACATCVAAHHTPAIVMPAIAAPAPDVPAADVPVTSHSGPVSPLRSARFGRAPPPSPTSAA
jgi:hypothetical protein